MKQHFLLFILFALCTAVGAGAADMDGHLRNKAARSASPVAAFVTLDSCADTAEIVSAGASVLSRSGNMALVSADALTLERLADSPWAVAVRGGRRVQLANDRAVRLTGVDKIRDGSADDGHSYTGKGVVTGIFDAGFDFQNPAFRSDGHSRVKRIFEYTDSEGTVRTVSDRAEIDKYITDDSTLTHGSHVLGTIGGRSGSPYDGIAIESDILVSCGPLYDVNIADGVSRMAAYAKEQGAPCVINLSISSFEGPHDGSDGLAAYLSNVAEDAIIVVSAGNYAGLKGSLTKTIASAADSLQTFVRRNSWKPDVDGTLGIWSGDDRPIDLQFRVRDAHNDRWLTSIDVPVRSELPFVIMSADYDGPYADIDGAVVDEGFSKAYTKSCVALFPEVSASGRYGYYIDYFIEYTPENQGRMAFGLSATGETGQRIDLYHSSGHAELVQLWVPWWSMGRDDMPVSDMACGRGLVVVGAWTSRDTWVDTEGKSWSNGYAEGRVAPFSSYGRLIDGRELPLCVAPGSAVASVVSTPFMAAGHGSSVLAMEESDGRTNYWNVDKGTSMSAPVVAGSIALWLEADPSLNSEDVVDIIMQTSTVDAILAADEPLRRGAGKFDAFEGLREVVRRRAALAVIDSDKALLVRLIGKNIYEVTIAGRSDYHISIVDTSGRVCLTVPADGDTATVDASSLASGLYVLQTPAGNKKLVINNK